MGDKKLHPAMTGTISSGHLSYCPDWRWEQQFWRPAPTTTFMHPLSALCGRHRPPHLGHITVNSNNAIYLFLFIF